MRSQLVVARAALAVLVLAALAAAAAVAGVRLGGLDYALGLKVMAGATVLGLAALGLALWWLKGAITHNVGTGKRLGLAALIGSLALLWPPLSTAYYGLTMPAIHDAATDPDEPPPFVALAKLRQAGENGLDFDGQRKIRFQGEEVTVSYALHAYKNGLITHPHTRLLPNSADPVATIFWHCFEVAKQMGWTVVDTSPKEGRIEATAKSPWFGQVSDIVIRVRRSGIMGARADARAESRVGTIDNGFNIFLLRDFKAKAGI
jgi:Protein of unknown function (DUF1499)